MRTAIYGAGSLGTVLGAYLTQDHIDVDLINRNRAHVEALKRNGAHITGTVEMTVPVRALLPEEMAGKYDIIFLMTKQLNNRETVAFLKDFLADDGILVTLQNGIPEDGIAEIVGADRTVGCVVEWGATMTAPGESMLTSVPDSLSFHMGGMPGIPADRLEKVKAVLEHMCPVELETNLPGARWSKLLINATFSGIGTVIGGTFGAVTADPAARDLAARCMKEVIDVGRAAGVTFAPVQGKDIIKLFYWKGPVKKAFAKLIMPVAMKKHAAIEPSMLQDLKKGRPCEIDAINGVVRAWGKKTGVPTPVNDWIVQTVQAIQDGKLTPGPQNLSHLP
ncbi:MAG: 2-dehydropantoate 2-reductase [Clostridia bacterium]|nr:2-dehydropantoate 2-reductase [Clostridia bacterium]